MVAPQFTQCLAPDTGTPGEDTSRDIAGKNGVQKREVGDRNVYRGLHWPKGKICNLRKRNILIFG